MICELISCGCRSMLSFGLVFPGLAFSARWLEINKLGASKSGRFTI